MPMGADPLSENQIALIRAWIDQAPDAHTWLAAQVQVLQLCAKDRATTRIELEAMERRLLSAPFDGFLKDAPGKPGMRVGTGHPPTRLQWGVLTTWIVM